MPQPPCWQPAFGLVISSSSRSTCRSAVSGALEISCSRPLTVSLMRSPVRRVRAATSTAQHLAAVRGAGDARRRRGRRPSGRLRRCGSPRPSRARTAVGPTPGDADAKAVAVRAGRDVGDRVRVRVAAAQRLRRPGARRRRRTRSRARGARAGRRRGSPRPAPSARRPCRSERTRAPSAISGAPRSPRCAPWPAEAQRLPPTVAAARTSTIGDLAARSARAARRCPSASAETGAIAPIRTTPPSRADPVEAAAVQKQRTRRLQPAGGDLRHAGSCRRRRR